MITLLVDILIVVLIIIGALKGWKSGGITTFISLVATIFIFIASFYLKDIIAPILYENLPFFEFTGMFEGVSSINIFIYEMIAYIICIIILLLILAIILKVTRFIDKIVNLTIILAIPNKILGLIFGAIQYYIIVYFIVFIFIQLPITSYEIKNTEIGNSMIKETPLLSEVTKELNTTYNEVYDICLKAQEGQNKDELNRYTLEIMMKHDLITIDDVKVLRNKGKLQGQQIDNMINESIEKKNDN